MTPAQTAATEFLGIPQVVYGLILGLVACFICSLTRIWNNGFKRAAAVLFCGLAIMWLGLKLAYLGASSVGCLSLTVMVSLAWERGFPPRFCKGQSCIQQGCHAWAENAHIDGLLKHCMPTSDLRHADRTCFDLAGLWYLLMHCCHLSLQKSLEHNLKSFTVRKSHD